VGKSNKADKIISGNIFHKNCISAFIKSTNFSETNAFISDPPSHLKHVGECSFFKNSFGWCDTGLLPLVLG
jgi:hypothetical protein